MGLLAYLLIFWTVSHLFHEYLAGKRHKVRRKIKHLRKNLLTRIRLDSDILLEKNLSSMQEVADNAADLLKSTSSSVKEMEKFLKSSEKKITKAYPEKTYSGIRETIEMLVVVFGIVMGVRAILMQPFKIPTGSMQPTLFGVHFDPDAEMTEPGRFMKILDWMNYSAKYVDMTITEGGRIDDVRDASLKLGKFPVIERTQITVGGKDYVFPGSPSNLRKLLSHYNFTGAFEENTVIRGQHLTGDHIMVDRFSYNFIEPKRGDIFVFVTDGLANPDSTPLSGRHYIKRLVGLPGDTLKIDAGKLYVKEQGSDEFVVVDGKFDKAFEHIYSDKGWYHGYTYGSLHMTQPGEEFKLEKDQYFAMGDNSGNSHDSRGWGFVPRQNIIGRALLVWWPFSRRWGPVDSAEPLDFKSPNMTYLNDE